MKNILFACILASLMLACSSPKETLVKITTPYGDVVVKLYDSTVQHKENFIKLASRGYFDGLLFHRVIEKFMIQGGDPTSRNAKPGVLLGDGDTNYTVPFEYIPSYLHKRGAFGAAREGDDVNPLKEDELKAFHMMVDQRDTASIRNVIEKYHDAVEAEYLRTKPFKITDAQRRVYTTIGGTPHLDGAYTVFGEVVSGMEVVDKIAAVKTDTNDRPVKDIPMTIKLIKN